MRSIGLLHPSITPSSSPRVVASECSLLVYSDHDEPHSYRLDQVYNSTIPFSAVFHSEISPLVDLSLNGQNTCMTVFAPQALLQQTLMGRRTNTKLTFERFSSSLIGSILSSLFFFLSSYISWTLVAQQ
ncbi:hypothetical protein GEMRC1_002678 [Eukaryota sp. GEM-RC1]